MSPAGAPRLAIDTSAEAALRASGELEGAWQVPSELVRRAFRAGATRVRVACRRGGFAITDDGPALSAETRALVERSLDPRRAGREDALERLESGADPELRFLAALERATVEVDGSAISVSGLRFEAGRARDWLGSVGRFAGPAIELDGTPLAVYEPAHVASLAIASPWPGRLWLRESGEDGIVWLLRDRMLAAYLVLPGSLPFETALDLSRSGAVTAAALRDLIAPTLAGLVDDAARLTCETAARAADLNPSAARRVRTILLAAARMRRWRGPALRVAAYPARVGPEQRWLSLADLGSPASAGPDRRIPTCEPADVPRSLFLSSVPAVVVDAAERSRLSQELGLRFARLPLAERERR